jgi:hypothetical protein
MARTLERNASTGESWRWAVAALIVIGSIIIAPEARALSEVQREDVPVPADEETLGNEILREQLPPPEAPAPLPEEEPEPSMPEATEPPDMTVPFPDPVVVPQRPPSADDVEPEAEAQEPVPAILYDLTLLPEPVRVMRERIMEACLSGDVEELRPLISSENGGTQLSFSTLLGDPIEFLKELSGDDEGQEILAILYEVMAAGYVKLDEGQPDEMYVWPYFFAVPLEALDLRQRVELFKLVTAGDYEDMKNYGTYIFYRVGISPEGRWLFFVAGD